MSNSLPKNEELAQIELTNNRPEFPGSSDWPLTLGVFGGKESRIFGAEYRKMDTSKTPIDSGSSFMVIMCQYAPWGYGKTLGRPAKWVTSVKQPVSTELKTGQMLKAKRMEPLVAPSRLRRYKSTMKLHSWSIKFRHPSTTFVNFVF